jgi:hypothetical protein
MRQGKVDRLLRKFEPQLSRGLKPARKTNIRTFNGTAEGCALSKQPKIEF